MAKPIKAKNEVPPAAERSEMIAKLRAQGLPASAASTIVSAGKSRAQIVAGLIAYCRGLKKA